MPNATGAFTKFAIKKAATWGTAATGDYLLVPAKSIDLQPRQPFLPDPIIGMGRENRRPGRDRKTTDGRITVPLDSRNIGHWLQMLLGAPTTTGAGPYTHVFKSSTQAIKFYSSEQQFLNLATPIYTLINSMKVDTFRLPVTATGLADVEMGIKFDAAVDGTSSGAGTPAELTYTRFQQFDAVVKKDGTNLAKITSLDLNYNNNMADNPFIGGVVDVDEGQAEITGTLEARFADNALGTLADGETLFDLQVVYTKSASEKLTLELEQCELTRNGRTVPGPGGIPQSFQLFGSKDLSEGQMLTATLINDVASY